MQDLRAKNKGNNRENKNDYVKLFNCKYLSSFERKALRKDCWNFLTIFVRKNFYTPIFTTNG